jgi:DNA (cytosine-5)-methyltransferase 1
LSDEVEVWLKETQPRVAYLENVEEYETAGPLDEHGHEIKEMRGLPFKRRVARWRRLGYRVQHRKLRACDYGAPTMRRRLYVIMRRDGLPIVWPKPTHGHPDSPAVKSGKLLSWRTAAECIDWSISCPSIFTRQRDLAEATKRRIAHGVMRYVVNAARPFIVDIDGVETYLRSPFVSFGQQGGRSRPADAPMHTVCASAKDTNGVITAFLSSFYGSDRKNGGASLARRCGPSARAASTMQLSPPISSRPMAAPACAMQPDARPTCRFRR